MKILRKNTVLESQNIMNFRAISENFWEIPTIKGSEGQEIKDIHNIFNIFTYFFSLHFSNLRHKSHEIQITVSLGFTLLRLILLNEVIKLDLSFETLLLRS